MSEYSSTTSTQRSMHQLDKVAQKRLLLQLGFLEFFFSHHIYVWSQGNRNAVSNQHGDHECMEVPNEGNAQNEVPKFPILEGKSSQ